MSAAALSITSCAHSKAMSRPGDWNAYNRGRLGPQRGAGIQGTWLPVPKKDLGSQQYWGSFGRSLWRDKKESLLHLAGGGGTGPSHRKAVSARQGTDLGTGGLGGSRQVDCSIIGLARCPHTSIKCFQQPCEGRLDPPIFQMRKRRLGAMQGTCRDPSVGTWQRTFSATPCPLLILFQAHSLCLEVLCSGAQLHLY